MVEFNLLTLISPNIQVTDSLHWSISVHIYLNNSLVKFGQNSIFPSGDHFLNSHHLLFLISIDIDRNFGHSLNLRAKRKPVETRLRRHVTAWWRGTSLYNHDTAVIKSSLQMKFRYELITEYNKPHFFLVIVRFFRRLSRGPGRFLFTVQYSIYILCYVKCFVLTCN